MKKAALLALVLIAFGTKTFGQDQKVYRVYDSQQVAVPKYYVKQRPDGSKAVIDPKHSMILPKYIVKDGRVYNPSKSMIVPQYKTGNLTNSSSND